MADSLTLSTEKLDAFVKAVNSATPHSLDVMVKYAASEANDYAHPANIRAIYRKLATLLRNELKGWKRNPVKKKTASKKKAPRNKNPAHEIRELILYADNTAELQGQKNSIIQNLQRKVKRGTYDKAKAAKLWQYLIDNAVRHYNKEFLGGGLSLKQNVFTMADRKQAAKELEEQYRSGIHYGNNPVKKKTPRKTRVSKKRASNPRRRKGNIYEIYTRHPETGEGGWDIKFVRSTPDQIKSFPLFGEIITVNDYPMQGDGSNIIDWFPKSGQKKAVDPYDGKGPHIVFLFDDKKLVYVTKRPGGYSYSAKKTDAHKFRSGDAARDIAVKIQMPQFLNNMRGRAGVMKAAMPASFAKRIQGQTWGK